MSRRYYCGIIQCCFC